MKKEKKREEKKKEKKKIVAGWKSIRRKGERTLWTFCTSSLERRKKAKGIGEKSFCLDGHGERIEERKLGGKRAITLSWAQML